MTHDKEQSRAPAARGLAHRPEVDLLLQGAVLDLFPANEPTFRRLLEGSLDWPRLTRLAIWHRLTPLLAVRLQQAQYVDKVPPEVLASLRQLRQRAAIFRQVRYWETSRVLAALDQAGIEAIVLKGFVLAETVYPEAAQRPMKDVDLLLRESDLAPAEALIRGFGYGNPDYSSEVTETSRKNHRHIPELWHPDGSVCFELHRHIVRGASPLHFDIDAFRSRARRIRVDDLSILVLAREDLLIHLCLNVFQDLIRLYPSDAALGKLVDIVRVLRDGVDCRTFVERTGDFGLERPVVCVLEIVRRLFPAGAVAEEIFERLGRDVAEPELAALIQRRVLRSPATTWLFHSLVEWPDAVTSLSELKSGLRRLFAGPFELASLYGARPLGQLLHRHVKEVLLSLRDLAVRPGDLRDDLKIDRWLYTLQAPRSCSISATTSGNNSKPLR